MSKRKRPHKPNVSGRHQPKALFERLLQEANRPHSPEEWARVRSEMFGDALSFCALTAVQVSTEEKYLAACRERWAWAAEALAGFGEASGDDEVA
jgi:hypothetical protein